jgi:hypothetical protein
VPVGVTGHRTPNPAAQGPSLAPRTTGTTPPQPSPGSSHMGPGGERWPIFRPLPPVTAQRGPVGLSPCGPMRPMPTPCDPMLTP